MNESYEGREQSEAKHLILERYLEKLAYKIGLTRSQLTLNYIDGFAGPWESVTDDLQDTSPAIALRKLTEVRGNLIRDFGRSIDVRAFFVTKTRQGVEQLEALRPRFPDAAIEVVKSTFEGALEDAQRFAAVGRDPFTFIFIDHKGWSGFGLNEMAPLLSMPNNEVLINFMTEHIRRFVDGEGSAYEPSFHALFGDRSASYREDWRGLAHLDREDQIVATYCERVAIAGRYRHCVSGPILMPNADRTYFHLVYGTRSDEGLATMRQVEREGMSLQRDNRAAVQERERLSRSNQPWLLPVPVSAGTYEDELHSRYSAKARAALEAMLEMSGPVLWSELVMAALQYPMVSEHDVKLWLKEQQRVGVVEVVGLGPRESVPKRDRDHRVRRIR